MNFKMKVEITEQTYSYYKVIMSFFRLHGALPVHIKRDKLKLYMQFSPIFLILWWIVSGFIVVTMFWGMYLSAKAKFSSTMNEAAIDQIMFVLQDAQYTSIVVVGTYINPMRFGKLFEYIRSINKIDSLIKTTYKFSEMYKWLFLALVMIVHNSVHGSVMLYNLWQIYGARLGAWEVLKRYTSMPLTTYMAYVAEYIILILLKSLETRIRRFNEVLLLEYHSLANSANFVQQNREPPVQGSDPKKVDRTASVLRISDFNGKSVAKLTKIYMKIIDAADVLNDFLKISFLITTMAVFWSIIYVMYIFILSLTHERGEEGRMFELISASIQLYAHTLRALMIMNPAHDCLTEVETTKGIVCKMLSCKLTPQCRREVDYFAIVLGLRQLEFSGLGFITIDRVLFTSLVDAITTILMVMYEYRSTFNVEF